MLNSEHKPIARAPTDKENEKPSKKINIFSQPSGSALKPDLEKLETRGKRESTSSATSASTVAQSQQTVERNSTARQSVSSRLSRKRAKPSTASTVKVGVKRKAALSLGKSSVPGMKAAIWSLCF